MTFGEKLHQLRTAAGMSQKALAEAAGLVQGAVAHWESGTREPGWASVLALCKALGVECTAFADCKPGGVKQPQQRGRPKKG
jgi:transcriptional regulator with XRE-family HTH domain